MKTWTVEQWNILWTLQQQPLLSKFCWQSPATGGSTKALVVSKRKELVVSKRIIKKVHALLKQWLPNCFFSLNVLSFVASLVIRWPKLFSFKKACGAWCMPPRALHSKAQFGRAYLFPSLAPHDESKQQNHFVKIWNSEKTTVNSGTKHGKLEMERNYCAPFHPSEPKLWFWFWAQAYGPRVINWKLPFSSVQ